MPEQLFIDSLFGHEVVQGISIRVNSRDSRATDPAVRRK
jgi:hypothetical protein